MNLQPEENLEAELYEICRRANMNYNQFKLVKTEIFNRIIAYENAGFYLTLTELSNSLNNAGWESRHSSQIDIINKASNVALSRTDERLLP